MSEFLQDPSLRSEVIVADVVAWRILEAANGESIASWRDDLIQNAVGSWIGGGLVGAAQNFPWSTGLAEKEDGRVARNRVSGEAHAKKRLVQESNVAIRGEVAPRAKAVGVVYLPEPLAKGETA